MKFYKRPELTPGESRKLLIAARRIFALPVENQILILFAMLAENQLLVAEVNEHRQERGYEILVPHAIPLRISEEEQDE